MKNLRWSFICIASLSACATFLLMIADPASAHEGHRHAAKPESAVVAETPPAIPVAPMESTAPKETASASVAPGKGEPEKEEEHEGGLLAWLGRLHPAVVHFPIAFLAGALLGELLFMGTGGALYDNAGRFLTHAAAVTAPVAAVLGYLFANPSEYSPKLYGYFWSHRLFGILAAILALGASALRETLVARRNKDRLLYRILLAAAAFTVLLAGYLGACCTWGPEHLIP